MARYYEETALIEFVKKYTPHINGETTMECVERAIRNAPTADVVPRAEYEKVVINMNAYGLTAKRLQEDIERLQELNNRQVEDIRLAKAEVAREIFEEIEFDIHQLMFERDETRAIAIEGVIAELKKKYMEVEIKNDR